SARSRAAELRFVCVNAAALVCGVAVTHLHAQFLTERPQLLPQEGVVVLQVLPCGDGSGSANERRSANCEGDTAPENVSTVHYAASPPTSTGLLGAGTANAEPLPRSARRNASATTGLRIRAESGI